MGGGGQKSFYTFLRGGFKKFWRLAKGVKNVWRQKFSIAQPPQSIYEHSLTKLSTPKIVKWQSHPIEQVELSALSLWKEYFHILVL